MKRLVILGTNHHVQMCDYQSGTWFQRIINEILTRHALQFVLEEGDLMWESSPETVRTVGRRVAESRNLPWKNIGTPDEPQFATDGKTLLGNGELPILVTEYGPIENQTNRERWMTGKIVEFMDGFNDGLFVCGLCHVQSMAEKLVALEFDVRGYTWQEPVQMS